MKIHKFQFQISERYLTGLKIIRPYYAEVLYSIEMGTVKIWQVTIPFDLLAYIHTSGHFMTDIQCAAENNAESMELIPVKPVYQQTNDLLIKLYDHFKI